MTRRFGFVQKTIGIGLGVLFAVACGQAPTAPAIPQSTLGANGPNGGFGLYQVVPPGMTPQYFAQWCSSTYFNGQYGQVATSGGVQVCRHRPVFPLSGIVSIPMSQLSPGTSIVGQPLSGLGYFQAMVGDKITATATGSYNCRASGCGSTLYDLDGRPDGSAAPATHAGMAAGFTVSDGTKVYLLGSNGSAVVENAGSLTFGINFFGGSGGYSGLFNMPAVRSLEILRCVDIANKTYPCS